MRYLVQFLVPALIFVGVVLLLTRQRQPGGSADPDRSARSGSDVAAFVIILALGAVVALGTGYLLTSIWD